MTTTLKVIIISTSLTLVSAVGSLNSGVPDNEQIKLDNIYACSWWPTCRDPDQQKPADTSSPKPSGGKDTTKDNKDETRFS